MMRWVSCSLRQVDYYFYPSSHVLRDLSVSLVDLYVSFVCVVRAFMAKSGWPKGMKFQLKANFFWRSLHLRRTRWAGLTCGFLPILILSSVLVF